MRQLIWIPVCLVALAVPVVVLANGGSGGFDGVVSSIEGRYQVHATRIPFLGLISLVAPKATHGVGNLHVAEIENFSAEVDGDELNKMVEEKLGSGWERMIRETHRGGGEQTLIFMRPEGERMGLFVVDVDGHEVDVVQVSVDPDHLQDSIGKYSHHQDGDVSD
ncbi:MAG TPA: hypothetical protein VK716_13740 [Terracidiphilus sp.]|jgi:hypothetical protein|nr:hypothetical protein [Terracidiphilus sp.]